MWALGVITFVMLVKFVHFTCHGIVEAQVDERIYAMFLLHPKKAYSPIPQYQRPEASPVSLW